ncbi:mitochondrial cytochrome-like protein b2 [Coniella lustricola]|uniref:Mitochondrial cytochrome-like protein b2 n=1 Tax=Coniella lustricola TaxID=2025994 RepID=A0A2T2ZY00_9PEZI|nr:mitochondrial cytochrome-like protein b2 [Coniella lustricola]
MAVKLAGSEIANHKTADSCWIVIENKVYDVTGFLNRHPGGRGILLKQGGTDATNEFNKVHPISLISDLPPGSYLGDLDPATATALRVSKPRGARALSSPPTTAATDSTDSNDKAATETTTTPTPTNEVIPLSLCMRAADFRAEAQKVVDARSWFYAMSSANGGHSLRANLASWDKVTFRPRVLRDVRSVSTHTSILGQPAAMPFFVSPMGTMGLFHPAGELELVHGLVRKGLHAVISTVSSKGAEAIMQGHAQELAKAQGEHANPSSLFFQLYLPPDKQKGVELVRQVKQAGYKGLFVTVDTNFLGKRTEDRRNLAREALEEEAQDDGDSNANSSGGAAGHPHAAYMPGVAGQAVRNDIAPTVRWEDLAWIRREWPGPMVLKGIQTAEDARLAVEHNCQGIVLSNHGGRQQPSAPSALATLLEIRAYAPDVLGKLEVYLDGGCRDGADILKALALGATAVGIGRPFLYALAAYGSDGVQKLIDILSEELTLGMALLGVTSLDQLRPDMVNARVLQNEMWVPELPSILSRL